MTGFCAVISIFAIFWDAGEFSEIAKNKRMIQYLKEDGHVCQTSRTNFTFHNATYVFHDCRCEKEHVLSKLPETMSLPEIIKL